MNTAAALRAYRGPAVFSLGLRPFFLFGALWSAVAAPLWLYAFLAGGPVGLGWHIHEMLFGYTGGVVAGFLLTAVPNWTGRLPVVGRPLAQLFALWAAGRAAMLAKTLAPSLADAAWPGIIDSLFLSVMAGLIWREAAAGRNGRNLPVAVMVSLFALANIGFHLEAKAGGVASLSTRLGLGIVALLIAVIGGRITPSFTRNWQIKRGGPLPAVAGRFDAAALIVTAVALTAWCVSPAHPGTGATLLTAGGLTLLRLGRWRGHATLTEPLVWILHLGNLWLAASLILMGLSITAPRLMSPSVGVHALTAGAVGVMTLAVMRIPRSGPLPDTGSPAAISGSRSPICCWPFPSGCSGPRRRGSGRSKALDRQVTPDRSARGTTLDAPARSVMSGTGIARPAQA